MIYRISGIKLKPGENIKTIPDKILKQLKKSDRRASGVKIKSWKIVKESLDARKKPDIFLTYTVDFETDAKLGLETPEQQKYEFPAVEKSDKRPVIVGFGPCGMFCALVLAQAGLRPTVIERGGSAEDRMASVKHFFETGELDENSNIQFGEGGAGTFSDGKLTTGIKDRRIRKVLDEFIAHGAPEETGYKAKPHIGTDVLRDVVSSIRRDIISLGGEVLFDTLVTGLNVSEGRAVSVKVKDLKAKDSAKEYEIPTDAGVVFAIGHSSRDTLRWLSDAGIDMVQKPFSIGVRIEHPQDLIDKAQYGAGAHELGLPPAEYKLSTRVSDGRGVYTFCMCPGGHVIAASSQRGGVVTNGMSYHDRASGTANSALLVDVKTSDFSSDDVLAGVYFQEKYERLAYENGIRQERDGFAPKGGAGSPEKTGYFMPQCTWKEMREGSGSAEYTVGSLPEFAKNGIIEAIPEFGKKLKGFDSDSAVMTAVETRSSSPVRFARNDSFEGSIKGYTAEGFFPAGEGAGYAGGIMSAAVDGIRIAEEIARKYFGREKNV